MIFHLRASHLLCGDLNTQYKKKIINYTVCYSKIDLYHKQTIPDEQKIKEHQQSNKRT